MERIYILQKITASKCEGPALMVGEGKDVGDKERQRTLEKEKGQIRRLNEDCISSHINDL